jgi:integrative and conjugative element protein (TIGR02256 family)
MDKFWIEKAHRYISTHSAFSEVSDIEYSEDKKTAVVSAVVNVNLPAVFIEEGITDIGVKNNELVRFKFSENFPFKAPHILLRDDFPRGFPHINPSTVNVNPCIFEGSPTELLQQAEWMNGILNQLVDWLEKAASNSLLNYEQGWEPIRIDNPAGWICYDQYGILDFLKNSLSDYKEVQYQKINRLLWVDFALGREKTKKAILCVTKTQAIIDKYTPSKITTLSELYSYAKTIGITNIQDSIEKCDLDNPNHDLLFCLLAVKRPCNLINSDSNTELLNFVIRKTKQRKKKRRNLKRVLPDCKVDMLHHIDLVSPKLLKRISGSKQEIAKKQKAIAVVGCGSLGSKIALHLARNGNQPFHCIDNDIFLPHNNARHALSFTYQQNKAELLALSIRSISGQDPNTAKDALSADYSNCRIIIDSTASHVVRSFLMRDIELPHIISMGLYNRGKFGILLIENKERSVRLSDLWAHLYLLAMEHTELHGMLFSSQQGHILIGQSCSSNTLIMSDAVISLYAASFSLRIQNLIENGFPKVGEILFEKQGKYGTLLVEQFNIPNSIIVRPLRPKIWQTRLSAEVEKKMREQNENKRPNETGGILLGSVFLNAKTIVITDMLNVPSDSIETPSKFILGTEGLENHIKNIERKTNGKVTYLGTWHSHPSGGSASETDKQTSEKLLFVRDYEPTVCLIWTPDEVVEV